MLGLTKRLLGSTALTRASALALGIAAFAGEPSGVVGGSQAFANPVGGQVVGGSAFISQSGSELDVTQSSNRAVIDWQSFSIGAGETTRFIQPGASSIAVNRVTGVDPSQILGRLTANGQVVLVNPNGILFGKGAQVNVGGLVASTAGISTQNAMNGNMVFDQPGNLNATIENDGRITARTGGLVALVAPSVINNGVISAKLGKVSLASGDEWTLDLYGDNLVSFDVTDKVKGSVTNTGNIKAGTIVITANAAKDIVGNAINMSGVVEATGMHRSGGTIVLDGGENGNVSVTGKLIAKGNTGGTVTVTGNDLDFAGATVDASGNTGGGTIAIGGGPQGSGTLHHAQNVTVDAATSLVADALQSGNGGIITVWSDGETDFYGSASAKGGFSFGNGGSIETSGHTLIADPTLIDTSATNGTTGNWLLDPYDLSINASGAAAIDSALATSNVTVQTTAATSGTSGTSSYGSVVSGAGGNISVNSAISWSSANSLTLSAYNSILVNQTINNTGSGGIVLRADNSAIDNGGSVADSTASISTGGSISVYYDAASYASPTTYSYLTATNATAYMLVNSVADLKNVKNNLSGTYALGANISAVGAFTAIGTSATPFTGIFDGNGGLGTNYSISGATITGTTSQGIFGGNSGTIRNVNIVGETVNANAAAATNVGGLVGYDTGTVTNDTIDSTSTITAGTLSNNVGGIIGYGIGDFVSVLSSSALVTTGSGSTAVGGIIGYQNDAATALTFAGTVVAPSGSAVGGIIGSQNGYGAELYTVTALASGLVSAVGATDVGGVIGLANAYTNGANGGTVSDTVIAGTANYIGGVIGFANNSGGYSVANNLSVNGYVSATGTYIAGIIANAQSAGAVNDIYSGTVNAGSGSSNVGGYIGSGSFILNSTFSGSVIAPNSNYVGGFAGSNTYISGSTVTSGGLVSAVGSNYVGGLEGYVYNNSLVNNTVSGNVTGAGIVGGAVGYFQLGTISNAIVSANVVASGNNIGGIVGEMRSPATVQNSVFSGTISAASAASNIGGILGGDYRGSFLNNVTATSSVTILAAGATNVGGIQGYNDSTITNAVSFATVTGKSAVGGIVGYNTTGYGSLVTAVSATGTVVGGVGSNNIGGVVGYNNATIIYGAATGGTVSAGAGSTNVGGFVGQNAGIITQTYSTDSVVSVVSGVSVGGYAGKNTGTLNYDYWATDLSGQAISNGGTALTSATLAASMPTGFDSSWNQISGYNSGFPFLTAITNLIAGTAIGDAGSVIGAYVNGVAYGSATANASGVYVINYTGSVITAAQDILTYLVGGTSGDAVRIASASSEFNVNIANNAVTETSDGAALTISALSTAAGTQTVGVLYTTSGGTVTATGTTKIDLEAGTSNIAIGNALIAAGNVTLNSTGLVTQTAPINAGSLTLNGAGQAYALNNAGNTVSALAGNTGSINLTDAGALNISGVTATGNVTVTGISGISVTGGLVSGGNVLLRGDSAGADNASNATVTGSISAAGSVAIYYDPTNYASPTSFSNITAGSGATEYMLVNSLTDLGNVNTNLAGTYALGKNISAIGTFAGIGSSATAFSGIFDGNGGIATYSLSGATMNAGTITDVGFFNNNSGVLRNLTLTGFYLNGGSTSSTIGELAGYNSGTISNLTVGGSITATGDFSSHVTNTVGGVVGNNAGTITGAIFNGTVTGGYVVANVGGIAGINSGLITASTATGTISGGSGSGNSYNFGGIAGGNNGRIIGNSASVLLTLPAQYDTAFGGIVGGNGGTVNSNTFSGTILASSNNASAIGGIIGTEARDGPTASGNTFSGLISSTMSVSSVGGIIGANQGGSSNETATGKVIVAAGSQQIGGLDGLIGGSIYHNAYDSGGSFTGQLTAGTSSSYIGGIAGYVGGSSVLAGLVGGTISVGSGSQDVGGLVGYAGSVPVTITGTVLSTAVLSTPNGTAIGGLVGYNDVGSTISGGTANEAVSGAVTVGGIAGYNAGLITGAAIIATGTVSGANSVGGIAGYNVGTVTALSAANTVLLGSNDSYAGGIAGQNFGKLAGDTFSGLVSAGAAVTYVGGIAGATNSNLLNGIFSGTVIVGTNAAQIGGLAGQNGTAANVSGSTATGTVSAGSGAQDLGGLIGYNKGGITSSIFNGTILAGTAVTSGTAAAYVGGLVGYNLGTLGATNTVSGAISVGSNAQDVGGLVGYSTGTGAVISGGTVSATAVLSAPGGTNVGGLVGYNDTGATISGGTALESVTGISNVGGYVGYNAGVVIGVTAGNTVAGPSGVSVIGGLIGYNAGTANGDGFNGTILAGTAATVGVGAVYVGGLIGYNTGNVGNSGTIVGTVAAAISVGYGTTDLGGLIGYAIGTNSLITGGVVSSATTMVGSVAYGGTGRYAGGLVGYNDVGSTISGGTAQESLSLAFVYLGGIVGYNIGLISGLTVSNNVTQSAGNTGSEGGVAGGNNGTISGVSAVGATISAGGAYAGGLVGRNFGAVNSSYSNDTVIEGYGAGGLVGQNAQNGYIANSTAAGTVIAGNGATYIGGVAGQQYGYISASTFIGAVIAGTASSAIGGITGGNISAAGGTGTIAAGNYVSGSISVGSNSQSIGGLVGYSGGATNITITGGIVAASATLSTPGSTNVGGLVGYNDVGNTINGGTALEAVSGIKNVGGFVGYNAGLVSGVSNSNSVVGGASSTAIGGLVGYNTGTVTASSTSSQVSVGTNSFAVGGLVGFNSIGGAVSTIGTGGVTAGAGSTYIHGGNQIGDDLNNGGSSTPGQQVITVTVAQDNTTYGTAAAAPSYTPTGTLESGDIYSNILSGTLTSTAGTAAGTYAIGQGSLALTSPYAALDYTINYVGNNVVVSKAAVTVTPTGSQTYGGTNITVSYSYTGLVNGDTSSVLSGVSYTTTATASSNVGSYSATEAGGTSSNYTVVAGTGAYSVTPAALTVTASGTQVYGGTSLTPTYTYTGLVNGNTSSVVSGVGYTTNATSASNVGNTYTATATGGTASNYTITDASGSWTVTPAALTVTASGTQVYGGTSLTPTYTYTGLVNGNTSSVVSGVGYTTNATSASNVGNTYTATATGGTASNYTITDASGSWTVTPAALTVTASGTQVYGGTSLTPTYTYTGLVNGNTSSVVSGVGYTTNATSASNVGNTYTATATGGTASNYTITDASGSWTVTPAALTVTASGTQVYGGSNVAVSYAYTGLVNGDASSVVSGVSYTTTATASSNVGSYSATEAGGTASNYTITAGTGAYSVTPAALTITPTGTQTYGGANVAVSYAYSGLVNGDTSAAISNVSYTTTATPSSAVGNYSATEVGGTSGNYTITGGTGLYTVGKDVVTVTPTGSQTYGGTNITVSYSYTGLVNGDTSSVLSGVSYTTTATASSNVGSYSATEAGGTSSNYTVVAGTGAYSVTPAALTVTASGTQVYGGTSLTPTYTYTGLVNGNTSSVVSGVGYTTNATSASNVGNTYTATATGGTASNYTITDASGSWTVTPAALTVTASGTQVYGGTSLTPTYTYTGLVNGNTSSVVSGVGYTTNATSASNVGNTYTATATGGTASNYTITDASGSWTVTPAALTVTASGTQVYGGTSLTPTYTYTGLVNGNTSSVVSGVGYTTNATSASNVGNTYTATATGGTASNYTITDASGSWTVTPAALTVTASGTQVYGGTSLTPTYTYTGLVNGNTSSVVSGVGYTTNATSASNVGNTYTATATGGTASNYTITDASGSWTVTPAALTVTASGTQVYGGTSLTPTYTYTGLVNGNTSSVVSGVGYTTNATSASNVGNTYTATATGGTASNYTITDASGSWTVTPAALTVTASGTQVYGGTSLTPTYTYTGLVNGNTSSVVSGVGYTTNATSASNVGNTYTATATGGTASNYTITDASGSWTVTPAALTVTASGTQVYGGSNVAVSYAYTGLVNGDASSVVSGVSYTTTATASSNVGSYSATEAGGTASNYTITAGTGAYSVTPAALTITPTGTQTYGGANVAVSYAYSGLVNGDTSAAISNVSYTTTATPSSAVGNYSATEVGGTSGNYTITGGTGLYTVGKDVVTVTPTGSQTYGGTNITVSYSYTGLVNGDTSSVLSGVSYTTTATASSNVGSYSATEAGGTSSNYTVVAGTGAYSVTPAALTVTASGTQVYGGTSLTPTYTYTGLVNGNTSSVVSGVGYTTNATSASNVGNTYTATATGGTASNYTITDASGSWTVTPAALTVTASGTQVYGGSNVAVSYAYTGLVNGDASSVVSGVSYTTTATASSNVGSYSATEAGGTASNYTITAGTGAYSVTPAALTITPTGTQTYGGANVAVSYAYSGLVNGDTSAAISNVSYTTTATPSSAVGNYSATEVGGTSGNYTITGGTGLYTVGKDVVTVTPTGSQTYGGTNITVSYSYTGLVNGDTSSVLSGVSYTTTATASSNVGSYSATEAGGTSSNYTVVAGTGAYSVTPAALTVTASGTQVYGGTSLTPTYTYTGLVNGNTSSVVSGVGYTTNATSASNVGNTYTATATGGTASNYTITDASGSWTVTPAALTVTASGTQVYGGTSLTPTYTYTGLVNGNTSSVVSGVSYTTTATASSNVGSYSATEAGGTASNYTITAGTGAYSVTPAALTITPTGTQTYGGAGATVTYAYAGLVNGDASTAITGVGDSTSVTNSSSAGTYGVTATGGVDSNYQITDATGVYTVGKANLTIAVNNSTRTYGASDPVFSATLQGLVNGDPSSVVTNLSYISTDPASATVGTYSILGYGASASNYSIVYTNGTLSVTPAMLTISAAAQSKTYGSSDPTLSYSTSGLQYSDTASAVLTGSLSRTAGQNVGSYAIGQNTLASNANYTINYVGNTLSITPATLTVSATAQSKTYGAADPTLTYNVSGLQYSDTSGTVLTGALSRAAGQNVGSYAIGQNTLASNANYTISYVGNTLSITPATLTVTAAPETKIYGASDPTLSYSVTGYQFSDTSSVITGALSRTAGENVGSYNITQNGLGAGSNYTISYVGNTLSITPASLTIAVNNSTRNYGASDPSYSSSFIGLTNGDGSSVVTGLNYISTESSQANVGSYSIVGYGASASNYSVVYTPGTLSITPASLIVTAQHETKTYGTTDPTLSYNVAGLQYSDTTNTVLTGSLSRTAGENVGSYAIGQNTLTSNSNYTLSYVGNNLTITPASLTISANNASRVFGTPDPTFSATYNGLTNGDSSAVVAGLQITANDPANASVGTSWNITPSGASASNYNISYTTGTLTISQGILTIIANNSSRTYGSANPTFSATYIGLVNNDTSSVVSGLTYVTTGLSSGVGTYALTPENATAGNYQIDYVAGTLTITPAPLTITANNSSRTQNQPDPVFTASFSGLVNGDSPAVIAGLGYHSADTTNSGPGAYQISVFGGIDPNYTINYVPGVLTVTSSNQSSGSGATGSSILSLVVNNQISDNSGIGMSTNLVQFVNQGVLSTSNEVYGDGHTLNTDDEVKCLKSKTSASNTCAGSLIIQR